MPTFRPIAAADFAESFGVIVWFTDEVNVWLVVEVFVVVVVVAVVVVVVVVGLAVVVVLAVVVEIVVVAIAADGKITPVKISK